MTASSLNLPNGITVARILACPVVFVLAFQIRPLLLYLAFIVFLAASLSDLWDGYLARKHGQVTDVGKLLDPLADKLLLVATVIPFYMISHSRAPEGLVPWWGELPLWVVLVIFGRELAVTVFRSFAARRGTVISAGWSGKVKAFVQNLFSGSLLLWYAVYGSALQNGWDGGFWNFWRQLHGGFVGLSLLVALVLTVYSLGVYIWQYRYIWSQRG
ncbi:MAG: CDP-diacylglycerol--glycerol-3-phosphate 3-phosphatidyltransferase [Gemmatimonadota bacterium]